MKYLIYALVLALTWAHVGPHIYAYYRFQTLQATIPACTLDMKWNWYNLGFDMGATNCIKVTSN